jgi:hypothetical protein
VAQSHGAEKEEIIIGGGSLFGVAANAPPPQSQFGVTQSRGKEPKETVSLESQSTIFLSRVNLERHKFAKDKKEEAVSLEPPEVALFLLRVHLE